MISEELEKTLQKTKNIAESFNHEYMTIEHLLCAMLEDSDAKKVFEACEIDTKNLKKEVMDFLEKNLSDLIRKTNNDIKPTLGFQRVIQRAVIHVQSSGKEEASAANVLVSLFSERESHAVYFLQKQNLSRLDVVDYISHGVKKNNQFNYSLEEEKNSPETEKENFVDQYCVNLNDKAKQKKIDPIIGREKEILRSIHILSRRNKNNPIFVGDPGVGKTAIAEGLALKVINQEVPETLKKVVIYSLI